jgi:hypothetical protein
VKEPVSLRAGRILLTEERDGSQNEEGEPDRTYVWLGAGHIVENGCNRRVISGSSRGSRELARTWKRAGRRRSSTGHIGSPPRAC